MDRSSAVRTLAGLWLAGCGQIVGIHTLTSLGSQDGVDDGGADASPALPCDAGTTCCGELAQCCPQLDAYSSVEAICASAVEAGVEQACAELLTVYRPECP